MARNGSGTYSKVNTFTAGTTITAAGHNQNWDDIATELTNSVAVDGQSTMTGPLKASNGSVSAPGYTFGSDGNTGIYRIGADNIGVTVGGTKILDVASTGLSVTGTITPSGVIVGAVGAVGAPSYTFTGDLDTGMYRIGANNIGLGVNGAKVLDIATTGLSVTGTLTSSGAMTVTSGGLIVTAGGLTVTAGGLTVTAGTVAFPAATYATQSDQETGSSTSVLVTPGRQHFHPSAAKAWGLITVSAGTPSLTAGNNVTSITDNGTGDFTVNLTNAFSSANFCVVCTTFGTINYVANVEARTASTIRLNCFDSSFNAVDPEGISFVAYGDL